MHPEADASEKPNSNKHQQQQQAQTKPPNQLITIAKPPAKASSPNCRKSKESVQEIGQD